MIVRLSFIPSLELGMQIPVAIDSWSLAGCWMAGSPVLEISFFSGQRHTHKTEIDAENPCTKDQIALNGMIIPNFTEGEYVNK
jgi:hypothetical protein